MATSWSLPGPTYPNVRINPVASFKELKLATAARNVLSAASRYRWHRWIQLQDQGIFTEERVGPDPSDAPGSSQLATGSGEPVQPPWLPRLPTNVLLGDAPMSDYLAARIEALVTGAGDEREPVEPDAGGFTERVSIGTCDPFCGETGVVTSKRVSMTASLRSSTRSWLR